MPEALDETEKQWTRLAIMAGMPMEHIKIILTISRATGQEPTKVQNNYMDAHIGAQQVWREMYSTQAIAQVGDKATRELTDDEAKALQAKMAADEAEKKG